ncbi:DUF1918 domain-containing protein [Nocardia sp. NPDC003482]|uniref:DUF1918 domain-containing protein n=1 Tax=Nocardia sp. NPDC004068 TaxID=3364303 RepID=UPI0036BECA75
MHASKGDRLIVRGHTFPPHEQVVEIVAVLGPDGAPPYRVRAENGHESIMAPGPDAVLEPRGGKMTD